MSNLAFKFEWESPGAARGSELRATWARLQILANGEVITRVEDRVAHSIREAIYGPLYPIAEWIVTNWWALLYEVASPRRIVTDGFGHRHNLAAAAEGFAVPTLYVRPEGSHTIVAWEPSVLPECRLQFLSRGTVRLRREQVEEAFRDLVMAVVARLEEEGVGNTPLAEEWEAILQADAQEQQFCKAVAQLGCDPYALEENDVRAVLSVARVLPSSILGEFLSAADHRSLGEQSQALRRFLDEASGRALDLVPLRNLRETPLVGEANAPPWEQGYAAAGHLRRHLGANGARIVSLGRLGEVLGVDSGEWEKAITIHPDIIMRFLDAVMVTTGTGSPYFAIESRPEAQKTFTLCRALCEYLLAPGETTALVTPTYSERQKRNRAFAAEFIAPAYELRRLIGKSVVSEDEIQEYAAEFGTSEYVIRHQLENHGIARIATLDAFGTSISW